MFTKPYFLSLWVQSKIIFPVLPLQLSRAVRPSLANGKEVEKSMLLPGQASKSLLVQPSLFSLFLPAESRWGSGSGVRNPPEGTSLGPEWWRGAEHPTLNSSDCDMSKQHIPWQNIIGKSWVKERTDQFSRRNRKEKRQLRRLRLWRVRKKQLLLDSRKYEARLKKALKQQRPSKCSVCPVTQITGYVFCLRHPYDSHD